MFSQMGETRLRADTSLDLRPNAEKVMRADATLYHAPMAEKVIRAPLRLDPNALGRAHEGCPHRSGEGRTGAGEARVVVPAHPDHARQLRDVPCDTERERER